MTRRGRWLWLSLAAAAFLGASALIYAQWSAGAALDAALADASGGRFRRARPVLQAAVASDPTTRRGLAALVLGDCEFALGLANSAVAAWSKVEPSSPYAGRAALRIARAALARHRLAEAERFLRLAVNESGRDGVEARQSLALILKLQGRIPEVREVFCDSLTIFPDTVASLRELWDLAFTPFPVGKFREVLTRAAAASPQDQAVRLGLAHISTLSGDTTAAADILRECLERAPRDPHLWRAELARARAEGNLDHVRHALGQLSDEALSPLDATSLLAWIAARRGDAATEARALEARLDLHPVDPAALDRLAELAYQRGDSTTAQSLRVRKAAVDAALERYRDLLFFVEDCVDHAAELARLATGLGLMCEARAWLRLALARDPRDAQVRTQFAALESQSPKAIASPSITLADLRRALEPSASSTASHQQPQESELLPAIRLSDRAAAVGLDFQYDPGRTTSRRTPETTGGGLAVFDFDGDDWLDVYAVQGGSFPPTAGAPNADRLFRNRGDGTFEDASERSRIASFPGGYGMGVTTGDIDNDGHIDLFITRWTSYALYRNRGDGTFEDVTDSWGLSGDRNWPSSAALADLDGDGDADLYVCHYYRWDAAHPHGTRPDLSSDNLKYSNPLRYEALPDHLFRNEGGRFVDVSTDAGITAADCNGRGLGVLIADFDNDSRPDIYVANDLTANYLFRNLGDMRFEEVAHASGVAGSAEGIYQGSMGVAAGDVDGDGLLDLAVTNFYGDSMAVYRGLGGGLFAEHTSSLGLKAPTRFMVGWGVALPDLNNDGRPELVCTNGHLDDPRDGSPYAMPMQLFERDAGGRFHDVTAAAGPALTQPRVGRALATGDLDNDGLVDILVASHDSPLLYLHNETDASAHSLTLELQGAAANRDAIGALVEVGTGENRRTFVRVAGGSYQSASDTRVHIGLGAAHRAVDLRVTWPSGHVDTHRNLQPDKGYRLVEAQAEPSALPGFHPAGAPHASP